MTTENRFPMRWPRWKSPTDMSEVCKPQNGTIYTHDEAMLIVEMFEDVLDTYNITVPSPEDDEREPDNEAKLYGSVYSDLLDDVEAFLVALLNRHKEHTAIVTDEFSGTV